MMIRVRRRRSIRRKSRRASVTERARYKELRESARALVMHRLTHFVGMYTALDPRNAIAFTYKRVAIRDQRGRWGSCSSRKNLNFNYRIVLVSPELQDYIIVHELCHLKELHHQPSFWNLVEQTIPNARALHQITKHMRLRDI